MPGPSTRYLYGKDLVALTTEVHVFLFLSFLHYVAGTPESALLDERVRGNTSRFLDAFVDLCHKALTADDSEVTIAVQFSRHFDLILT